jgi:C4-dicarboxylate-specific signal transduction histidine kinase
MNRQKRMLEISREKQQTVKKLMENQNLASLGQIAAGIAHELNNSIAVLSHNSDWLTGQLSGLFADETESALFELGLLKGRYLSSREVRQNKKTLLSQKNAPDEAIAAKIAEMGLNEKMYTDILLKTDQEIRQFYSSWEIGAALHDMQIASEQSAHVVSSVKSLGNQNKNRQSGVVINDTIQNAVTLMRHKIRNISLVTELDPLPEITANIGEFIQIWTNLIKNASEAMLEAKIENPQITIESEVLMNNIRVKVADNGPGIPKEIFSKIFQPNITTKVSGLSFGLGLGLTIVKRIITEYDGRIDVQTSSNGTSFTVYIPIGGDNVQA